ncbi:cupin domain-containing protein [Gemmatimonas aurantiaca]|nr:cupin domain-containing protein [Gemmatimonas aurantiaca]
MGDSTNTRIHMRKLADSAEFLAGDKVHLRELFNPRNQSEFSGRYSLAHASLAAHQSSKPHNLASHELYYILSGSGRIHIDSLSAEISAGCAVEIPPNSRQWIENTSNSTLEFLCIVDPAWQAEDETVESS